MSSSRDGEAGAAMLVAGDPSRARDSAVESPCVSETRLAADSPTPVRQAVTAVCLVAGPHQYLKLKTGPSATQPLFLPSHIVRQSKLLAQLAANSPLFLFFLCLILYCFCSHSTTKPSTSEFAF
jgi:hypothetical protein